MRRIRSIGVRLLSLFIGGRRERDLASELESHLQLHIDENMRAGMTPMEARRRAVIALGGVDQTKERYRDQRGMRLLESSLQDARFGVRMLLKNPGFTAIAVLTLSLGIGANTAIFSIAHAFLVEPIAGVELAPLTAIVIGERGQVSPADYLDIRRGASSFDEVAAYRQPNLNLTGTGSPERVFGAAVSANFFQTIAVRAAIGRTFVSGDDDIDAGAVAILSHRLWRQRFDADPSVVGRTIHLEDRPHLVVGVMPPALEFPVSTDIWIPLKLTPQQRLERGALTLRVVGRVQTTARLSVVQAEVAAIAGQLALAYPATNRDRRARVVALGEFVQGTATRSVTILLLLIVGVVLLIACGNIASLQLSRALTREREIAVRIALGADRLRVFQLLLWENIVLATLAGVVSLLFAAAWLRLLQVTMPGEIARLIPGFAQIRLDGLAVAVAAAAALASGVLCGLIPAWSGSRHEPSAALKDSGRSATSTRSAQRLRSTFVVSQIAVAFVLLVAAGHFIQGLRGLLERGDVHDPEHVVVLTVNLPESRYADAESRRRFYNTAIERLEMLPGGHATAAFSSIPLSNNGVSWQSYEAETDLLPVERPRPGTVLQAVSPGFFTMLHVPIILGRALTAADRADATPVAVISESLAARHWPAQNAVGKRIRLGPAAAPEPWLVVVGVAKDVLYDWLSRVPEAVVYRPLDQAPRPNSHLALRVDAAASDFIAPMRIQLAAIDPLLPAFDAMPLSDAIGLSLAGSRQIVSMVSFLGTLALFIALIGVYGVSAYAVTARLQEFGIRLALGAPRRAIFALAMDRGARLAIVGLVAGGALAFLATPVLRSTFFGVVSHSTVVVLGLAALLTVVTLIACYLPARRATRLDPLITLRAV